MKFRLSFLGAAVFGWTALFGFAPAAQAQGDVYPSQPIRMVVGFPAGGPTDVSARLIADALSKSLGQPVVVDNKPGANATIAAEQVARAKPDGYTILMAAGNHSINAVLYKNLKFDSEKAFAFITPVSVAPTVLVVNPKFAARTYAEFLALMKTSPGRFSYASAGSGGTPHLSAEMFKLRTGTSIVHIPYRGAAPAVTDLLGGQVEMMFATLGSVLPQIRAGQLRPIAVAAPVRSALLPDVPTFAESGLKDFRLDSWYGIVAPAGTPRAVVDRLYAELQKAVATPAYRERLQQAGMEPVIGTTPVKFTEQVGNEIASFSELVRISKLSID